MCAYIHTCSTQPCFCIPCSHKGIECKSISSSQSQHLGKGRKFKPRGRQERMAVRFHHLWSYLVQTRLPPFIYFSASSSASSGPGAWRRPSCIPCDDFEGGAPAFWRGEVGMNAFLQRVTFPTWVYRLAFSFPFYLLLFLLLLVGLQRKWVTCFLPLSNLEFSCVESQRCEKLNINRKN